MILEQLMSTSLFKGMDTKNITNITSFCDVEEFEDGDILISENDTENRDIFVLCKGSVEVVSRKNQNIGNEVVLSSGEVDILGELSWLLNIKRTATVRCKGNVTVIHIDGPKLKHYVETNTEIGYPFMKNLSELLAKRLTQTDNLLKQIFWKTNTE